MFNKLLKISNTRIFSFQSFRFARKINIQSDIKEKINLKKENETILNKSSNFFSKAKMKMNQQNDSKKPKPEKEPFEKRKIEIIQEEYPIQIRPYFHEAVSEKEKSYTSINVSQLMEEQGGKKKELTEEEIKIQNRKQKILKAKKMKGKKKDVILENIKRELPKEL
jgi:hypothetical protein